MSGEGRTSTSGPDASTGGPAGGAGHHPGDGRTLVAPPGPGPGTVGRGASPDDLVRATFASMAALVLVVDAAGHPVLVNPALLTVTGWTEEELSARPFWDLLVAPEDVEGARDHVRRAIRDGAAFPQEGDWLDRSGGRRRISSQNSVIRDADGAPVAVVTVGIDVTDRRRAEADLRERADTDGLTGLRNRVALFDALAAALTGPRASGCGLLFADLDGFKAANDSWGHDVGDLVLVQVAARLRRVTGVDDVVARLGGDEFVVLCPGGGTARLASLAEQVRTELSRPVEGPHGAIPLGVSVGTAVAPPGTDPDDLLRAADRHMYRMKAGRRAAGARRDLTATP